MAHEKYQTEGFVLGGYGYGESGRIIDIFTKEFGLIRAVAAGARKHNSKLNSLLLAPSLSRFSLVRGREVWRIVGGEEGNVLWQTLRYSREKISSLSRVFHFLSRFTHIEGGNDGIFSVLREFASFLPDADDAHIHIAEAIAVTKTLSLLGYIPSEKFPSLFSEPFSNDLLEKTLSIEQDLYDAINTAIRESHL